MAQHPALLEARHRAADEMQVGAADRARGQPHDGVACPLDLRLVDLVYADIADAMEHDCLQEWAFP